MKKAYTFILPLLAYSQVTISPCVSGSISVDMVSINTTNVDSALNIDGGIRLTTGILADGIIKSNILNTDGFLVNAIFPQQFTDSLKFYSWFGGLSLVLAPDGKVSILNAFETNDIDILGKASVRDSFRIASSGKYIRKVFESTTGDSLGFVYYNTTRVRADTV